MKSPEGDTQQTPDGSSGAREDVASSAQAAISALARGVVPLADLAFPWPPPAYAWPRRTAEEILAGTKQRREGNWGPRGRVLSLGSHALDEKLSGCFAFGSVVEIVGQAGTGKTQLALTLAAETIIQFYNMHRPCARFRESSPALPRFPDSSVETSEEPRIRPEVRDAGARIQGGCSESQNDQDAENHMKGCTGYGQKPAVVYYLHTEGAFPVKRLQEIVLHRQRRRNVGTAEQQGSRCCCACTECCIGAVGTTDEAYTKLLMQRVFTEEVSSEEQLWLNLTRRLPRLTLYHRVALVVLDSIAAIFRPTVLEGVSLGEVLDCACVHVMGNQRRINTVHQLKAGLVDRASKLLRIGALLRRLCSEHDFCCLILNQVSDTVKEQLPPSHSQHGYSVNVTGTAPLAPSAANNSEEVCSIALDETSTAGRLGRASWPSAPCISDGNYIWDTRSAHGPILENLGLQPSLGLTWGNCLNWRLVLHKIRARATLSVNTNAACGVGESPVALRRCRAIFGNDANINKDVIFTVDATGVVEA